MRLSRLLTIVAVAVACSDPNAPSGGAPRITALPRALSSGEEAVIGASNSFGFVVVSAGAVALVELAFAAPLVASTGAVLSTPM